MLNLKVLKLVAVAQSKGLFALWLLESTCQSVLGQDTEVQVAPSGVVISVWMWLVLMGSQAFYVAATVWEYVWKGERDMKPKSSEKDQKTRKALFKCSLFIISSEEER